MRVIAVALLAASCSGLRFKCPRPGYFQDPTSCTAFYRCMDNNMSYKYICPLGTRYDPSVSNCNHDALAPPCKIGATVAATPGPAQSPDQDTPGGNPLIDIDIPTDVQPAITPPPSVDHVETSSSMPPTLPQPAGDTAVIDSDASGSPSGEAAVAQETATTGSSSGDKEDSEDSAYVVSPSSLFACPEPGFFAEPSSCQDFYTCREISPGVLSAERLFRCPARYRFDPVTRLCQRQEKVECSITPSLFYSYTSAHVSQLAESQLDSFFQQPLRYRGALQLPSSYPRLATSTYPQIHYQHPSTSLRHTSHPNHPAYFGSIRKWIYRPSPIFASNFL